MNSKKNVNLRITSTQYSENLKPKGEAFLRELEKEDSVEILTEGTMYRKNDARYISYEESEEAGLADTHTLVKLSDGSIRIRRYGRGDDDDGIDMTLEPGILNITRYQIPMMSTVSLEVYTNRLDEDLDEEGYGKISQTDWDAIPEPPSKPCARSIHLLSVPSRKRRL